MHLLEDEVLFRSRDKVDDAVGDDAVGGVGLEGDGGDVAFDEGDIGCGISFGRFDGVRFLEHVLCLLMGGNVSARGRRTSFMSTPMARPVEPILEEARKMSKPAPLPRSTTVSPSRRLAMAKGLPQLSPRLAPSGMLASSSSE